MKISVVNSTSSSTSQNKDGWFLENGKLNSEKIELKNINTAK